MIDLRQALRWVVLGSLLVPTLAWANRVVVLDTPGKEPISQLGNRVGAELDKALGDAEIVRVQRPEAWDSHLRPARLARIAVSHEASYAVDSVLWTRGHRILSVLAVSAEGKVIYERSDRLPAAGTEAVVEKHARRLVSALKRDPGFGASMAAQGSAARAGPPMAKAAPWQPEVNTGVRQRELRPRSADATDDLGLSDARAVQLTLRLRGGLIRYVNDLSSTTRGGDVSLSIPWTTMMGAGAQVRFAEIVGIDATVDRHTTRIAHPVANATTGTVDSRLVRTTLTLGLFRIAGPLSLHGGVTYAVHKSSGHTPVIAPSWNRVGLLTGFGLGWGGLTTEGLAGRLTALAIPWARHRETASTSGERPVVYGAQVACHLRYQLPKLLGSAGGVFVQAAAELELLWIRFEGKGSRTAIDGVTPLEDAKERRITTAVTTSVGYVF